MSGVAREGFNLRNKYGRRVFWRYAKRGQWRYIWWSDTFMPFVCAVIGHVRYNTAMANEPPDYACRRCHQWLEERTHT